MANDPIYGSMSPETIKKFKSWQMRTIVVSMIGYAIFYFVRKNFSIAMPGLTAEYGISNTSFGIVIAIGSVVYGLSRFINGFIVDKYSSKAIMALGLVLCALSNLAFGFGVDLSYLITGAENGPQLVNMLIMIMGVTIVLNQYFQGFGYPPCARLLPQWIHPSELATKMSIWNTSHSIGASLAVVVCGYIMGHVGTDMSNNPEMIATIAANLNVDPSTTEGLNKVLQYAQHVGAWKWCFWMPAGLAFLGAIWLFVGLKDDPKSVGLPDLPDTKTVKDTEGANKVSQAAFLKHMVWKNRWVWTLAIANVFVYVLRMGVLDWGPKFLTEDRGMNIKSAAWVVAIFEITAIVGTIVAGWATDKIFKGKAHRMCLICMIGAVLFLGAFALLPNVHIAISTTFLAMGGFFIYGPQALIGIASANQATKEASATANGLAGVLGYLGSALSAIGVGIIADNFGWDWVFISFIAVGLIGALIFLSMWQAPRDGYKRSLEIKE